MAVDQPVCQRHGRPAVASRVRRRPDGTQEVEYLCEIDLAEEQMSSRFGGRGSLFDDFFSDFFGEGQTAGTGAGREALAPPRQVERVDVTQFFSDATRELLQRAAQTAVEWGSLDLESDHLLYAALEDGVVQHVLRQVDADPDAIRSEIEEEADKAPRTDVSARPTSALSTCSSRWPGTRRVGPANSCNALASRIQNFGAR
jgi:ATP-dependent Clp protease ATP-binding subunit ClpC